MALEEDLPQHDPQAVLEARVAHLEQAFAEMRSETAREIADLRKLLGSAPQAASTATRAVASAPVATRAALPPLPPLFLDTLKPKPAATSSAKLAKDGSLESRLGSQIFNRIGILLILIGTAWFWFVEHFSFLDAAFHYQLPEAIAKSGALSDDTEKQLISAIEDFNKGF